MLWRFFYADKGKTKTKELKCIEKNRKQFDVVEQYFHYNPDCGKYRCK